MWIETDKEHNYFITKRSFAPYLVVAKGDVSKALDMADNRMVSVGSKAPLKDRVIAVIDDIRTIKYESN